MVLYNLAFAVHAFAEPGSGPKETASKVLMAGALVVIVVCLLLFGFVIALIIFRFRAQRNWRFYATFVLSVLAWTAIGYVTGIIELIIGLAGVVGSGRTM